MIRKVRLLVAVALTIMTSVATDAEENFEVLKAKQIRARVVGKDISDGVHWWEYYRKAGTLISVDMGTQRTGIWKIKGTSSASPTKRPNRLPAMRCGCRATTLAYGSTRGTTTSSGSLKSTARIE
jgi:hypothetical protein